MNISVYNSRKVSLFSVLFYEHSSTAKISDIFNPRDSFVFLSSVIGIVECPEALALRPTRYMLPVLSRINVDIRSAKTYSG